MKKGFILTMALGILLGVSCKDRQMDDFEPEISGNQMKIKVNVAGNETRLVSNADFSTQFEKGDAIGIFVVMRADANEQAYPKSTGNYVQNVKWEYQQDGSWLPATEEDKIFYPVYDIPLDIYAYYPYQEDADPTNLTFKIQNSQLSRRGYALSDLMTARKAGVKNENQAVSLTFTHKLALVQAEVSGGNNPASARVTLKGIKPSVTLDLSKVKAEEEAGTATGDAADIAMYAETVNVSGASKYILRALVPVQELASSKEYVVKEHIGLGNEREVVKGIGKTLSLARAKVAKFDIALTAATTPTKHHFPVVRIAAGTFQMGSPATEPGHAKGREDQHTVQLTKSFDMAIYAVTHEQFCDFLNKEAAKFTITGTGATAKAMLGTTNIFERRGSATGTHGLIYTEGEGWKPKEGCEDLPITNVSWYGAVEYATWVGGRLPTEAEWEYACRAGTTTAYYWGETITDELVNFKGTINRGRLLPVYALDPNPWGLYNMSGNAAEWVSDWMANDYGGTTGTVVDPVGGASPDAMKRKVLKGGRFENVLSTVRSASRAMEDIKSMANNNGFRVVFDIK